MNAAPAKAKLKVLLIEDNPGDARLMREYLSDPAGSAFEMVHSTTLAEGLAELTAGGINLVLLDLSLPDSPIHETFKRAHASAPQVPIIVLSGQDDERFAIQTVQDGAQDYLVKSYVDTRLLLHAMRYAIERKRADEQLETERNLLRSLIDNLPDYIYVQDTEGRYLLDNIAHRRWLGADLENNVVGKTLSDFYPKESIGPFAEEDEVVTRSGHPLINSEGLVTDRLGNKRWHATTKVPLRNSEGIIIGLVGISRDITDRKLSEQAIQEANEELARHKDELQKTLSELQISHEDLKSAQFQLIQAEKMQSIGRLAAGVAHEVKNPLGILRMGADYLSQHLQSPDENVALILSDMTDAIRRADGIIMGLLDFSVPHALDSRPEDLSALLEQSLGLIRHELVDNELHLEKELPQNLPPVLLDPNKLKQIFVNLLTNAIHATPPGGTITVRTSTRTLQAEEVDHDAGSRLADRFRAGGQVVLAEVTDTGPGIPEEQLAKVFDPFFTTKPTGKGTGLGLTVTKKIVELHGGSLEIRNHNGGGVRVTIMFTI